MSHMLFRLLSDNKDAIVSRWRETIIQTYPTDSAQFLGKRKNEFANPIGKAIDEVSEGIFEELIGDCERVKLMTSLDNIIRIRAVQEFTPGQAVAFVFGLKTVVHEFLDNKPEVPAGEIREFESRVDKLGMMAFDLYSMCRDQMAEIRVNEAKRRSYKLTEQLNRRQADRESAESDSPSN